MIMNVDEIIDKINKSIYKDANKKTVVHGRVVKDIFLAKEREIEHYKRELKIKQKTYDIIGEMFDNNKKQLEELKAENEHYKTTDNVLKNQLKEALDKLKEKE